MVEPGEVAGLVVEDVVAVMLWCCDLPVEYAAAAVSVGFDG